MPDFPIPQPFASIAALAELSDAGRVTGAYALGVAVGITHAHPAIVAAEAILIVSTCARTQLERLEQVEQDMILSAVIDVLAAKRHAVSGA